MMYNSRTFFSWIHRESQPDGMGLYANMDLSLPLSWFCHTNAFFNDINSVYVSSVCVCSWPFPQRAVRLILM